MTTSAMWPEPLQDVDRSDEDLRAWVAERIHRLDADGRRSADTHLVRLDLPEEPGRFLQVGATLDAQGELRIRSCYFSSFYSSGVCRLISALDAGVAAGLSSGGRLVFSRRLTEGHDCCLARFEERTDENQPRIDADFHG